MEKQDRKAARIYLERVGYDVVEIDFDGFIVALQDEYDELAFIQVEITTKDMSHYNFKHVKRYDFEKAVSKFFKSHDDFLDLDVRYDALLVCVIGNDRALIKHYHNCECKLED